jgi:hypothetical protein
LHAYALNNGRPAEALAWTERMREGQPDPDYYLRLQVLDALYADGDSTAAVHAAAQLSASTDSAARAEGDAWRRMNRCVLAQWRIIRQESTAQSNTRSPGQDDSPALRICEAAAAALYETLTTRRAGAAVEHFDSLLAAGPFDLPVGDFSIEYANSALARAYEAAGQPDRALGAIRRRVYFLGWQGGLAASLREEARLARMIGDLDGALAAIDHYLALRSTPEHVLRDEVERLRRRREALVAER